MSVPATEIRRDFKQPIRLLKKNIGDALSKKMGAPHRDGGRP